MTRADDGERPEFLTVRELAELLRIKERKIYDLAAAGEVPCARVTGKLLFPEAAVRAWIAGASSGGGLGARNRPPVFLGSHDPLLEWALRQSRCGLATFLDGSLDGLARFRAGEGVGAGLHVVDADGAWNVPAVAAHGIADAVLVSWATRRRGIVMRREDAARVEGLADLRGRRVIPRQPESGTQVLFLRKLAEAGLAPADLAPVDAARSEADAVSAVAQGRAVATFGLEALADLHGLGFVPVVDERFDLLVDRRAWFQPQMQRLAAFCREPPFLAEAAAMPGYDVSDILTVRWNA